VAREAAGMKPRSLHWLRERINIRAVHKVIVVGKIAAFLIHLNRADLLPQAGAILGDGLEADEDHFRFSAFCFQENTFYPLSAAKPVYCQYRCSYADIHSVYEDTGGRPLVVMKESPR
jgi:hypothetical protein